MNLPKIINNTYKLNQKSNKSINNYEDDSNNNVDYGIYTFDQINPQIIS